MLLKACCSNLFNAKAEVHVVQFRILDIFRGLSAAIVELYGFLTAERLVFECDCYCLALSIRKAAKVECDNRSCPVVGLGVAVGVVPEFKDIGVFRVGACEKIDVVNLGVWPPEGLEAEVQVVILNEC